MKIKQIKMLKDNLLVRPVETEAASEFAHNNEAGSPVYEVAHAGPGSAFKPADLIILKPGHYDHLLIAGELLMPVSDDEIIGKAEGSK